MGEPFEIRGADGRPLIGRTEGPLDGELIFFHAGTPGSCHLYEGFVREGEKLDLRHALCLRPGYGDAPRQRGRSLTDCVSDVAAVADALRATRIYVLGHSGGAPHALACAAALGDRVISVAAVSGFAPRTASGFDWLEGMEETNGEEFDEFRAGGAALERFLRNALVEFGEVSTPDDYLVRFKRFLSTADRACHTGTFLDYQVESCKRVSSEGLWGWFDDDHALWGEWDFDLTQIAIPVTIWHGGEDNVVPVRHGEWLAGQIPGARFNPIPRPKDGHSSIMVDHYGEILEDLIRAGS